VYGIVVFVNTHPKSESGYNQIVSIMEMYEMVGLDVSGHIAHEYAFLCFANPERRRCIYITNRQKDLNISLSLYCWFYFQQKIEIYF
jgi:hypothetical protein